MQKTMIMLRQKKVMILLGLIVMGAYCTILTINMAIQKDGYG